MLPTLALVKIFSSRTQPVRALSTPSVRKSDAAPVTPANSRMTEPILAIRMSLCPLCEADRIIRRNDRGGVRPAASAVNRAGPLAGFTGSAHREMTSNA